MIAAFALVIAIAIGCSNSDGSNGNSNNSATQPNTEAPAATPDPANEVKRADASKAEVPANEEAQQMAKETLLEFNAAIQKGDFSNFYDSISDTWKKEIDAKTFEEAFSEFIEKKVDISAIAAKDAEFSPEPKIAKEQGFDMLTLAGSYNITPQTQFELKYIPEGKQWKLSRIRVMLGKQ